MSILVPPIGWNVGGLWTPADINPYAWYDAELSPKTFGTGTQVAQWNDISGNDLHAAQSTGSDQPTYSAADEWLSFDGTNDKLNCPQIFSSGNAAFTLIAVVRRDVATADKYFFNQGPWANNQGAAFGTHWQNAGRRVWGMRGNDLLGSAYTVGTDSVEGYAYSGAELLSWVDGTADISSVYSSLALGSGPVIIGGFASGAQRTHFQGKLRTLIGFRRHLTTDDRQKCEGYLAWRWGTQGSLPAGHPYKNAPPKK